MTRTPHAPLFEHLVRLRELAPAPEAPRPMFDTVGEAEVAAANESRRTGRLHLATPVWRIDHDALEDSEPVAWSFSRFPV